MPDISNSRRFATVVNHLGEHDDGRFSHTMPIYQTSTFGFVDVEDAGAVLGDRTKGRYVYTRGSNPNARHLATKIAYLEGMDLIAAAPERDPAEIVAGEVTSSGLAAIACVALTFLKAGDTAIVQAAAYGGALSFWETVVPRYGVKTVFVHGTDPESWAAALNANPDARIVYLETPSTPLLRIYDLSAIVKMAHGIERSASSTILPPRHTISAPYPSEQTTSSTRRPNTSMDTASRSVARSYRAMLKP